MWTVRKRIYKGVNHDMIPVTDFFSVMQTLWSQKCSIFVYTVKRFYAIVWRRTTYTEHLRPTKSEWLYPSCQLLQVPELGELPGGLSEPAHQHTKEDCSSKFFLHRWLNDMPRNVLRFTEFVTINMASIALISEPFGKTVFLNRNLSQSFWNKTCTILGLVSAFNYCLSTKIIRP